MVCPTLTPLLSFTMTEMRASVAGVVGLVMPVSSKRMRSAEPIAGRACEIVTVTVPAALSATTPEIVVMPGPGPFKSPLVNDEEVATSSADVTVNPDGKVSKNVALVVRACGTGNSHSTVVAALGTWGGGEHRCGFSQNSAKLVPLMKSSVEPLPPRFPPETVGSRIVKFATLVVAEKVLPAKSLSGVPTVSRQLCPACNPNP